MLVPLSWLKEYVPIKMPLPRLLEKLSEAGIGVENIHKKEEDTILELEITPNRPDLLSIIGVAREVAAIQSGTRILSVKIPKATIPASRQAKKKLPITIKVDYTLSPRISAVIIDGISVKESPLWLAEKLNGIGMRSINNIVDITNFVLFELGNPLHAFDYDQIKGHTMTVTQAAGGEAFTTVDNISYKLPKGANIIKDKDRIIDLCGIKGGLNSAITHKTKTVLLWAAVDDGPNIRKTCQALGLVSEASYIYERGVNKGGTLDSLARATTLILDLTGGHVASDIIDEKKKQFEPWKLTLSLERFLKLIGTTIDEKKILRILTSLNLLPQKKGENITVTIPTYRNDLQIEEDLIEEIARIYGYNKLPKTLPQGAIPIAPIPYESDFKEELGIKQIMAALGFAEANTYSLIAKEDLALVDPSNEKVIAVANPVSREFSFVRPNLLINLLKAIPLNARHTDRIALFELGRIYEKERAKEPSEKRSLAGCLSPSDFFDAKGVIEALFETLSIPVRFVPIEANLPYQKGSTAGIFAGKEQVGTVGQVAVNMLEKLNTQVPVSCFEIDIDLLTKHIPIAKTFISIPKYPPVIEDLSIVVDGTVLTGDIIDLITLTSPLVANVIFIDMFESTRTFRITFQNPHKNLTGSDASLIRVQILRKLKQKFHATLKS